jgi:hypothetical protein
MAAVTSLTQRALVVHRGKVVFSGDTAAGVKAYGQMAAVRVQERKPGEWGAGRHTRILVAKLLDDADAETAQVTAGAPFKIEVELETDGTRGLSCEALLIDRTKAKVALASMSHFEGTTLPQLPGTYRVKMSLAPLNLAAGQYTLDVTTSMINRKWDHYVEDALSFEVLFSNPAGLPWNFKQAYGYGSVALPFIRPTVVRRVEDRSVLSN